MFFLPVAASGTGCLPESFSVRGRSMEPLIKDGRDISVLPVACCAIARGDLVVFTSTAHPQAPVIKRVAGVPGDRLAVAKGGMVVINGVPALAPDGRPYIATPQGRRMISLYSGIIPAGDYLNLGSPGSLDSGRIGLVTVSEIISVAKPGRL